MCRFGIAGGACPLKGSRSWAMPESTADPRHTQSARPREVPSAMAEANGASAPNGLRRLGQVGTARGRRILPDNRPEARPRNGPVYPYQRGLAGRRWPKLPGRVTSRRTIRLPGDRFGLLWIPHILPSTAGAAGLLCLDLRGRHAVDADHDSLARLRHPDQHHPDHHRYPEPTIMRR